MNSLDPDIADHVAHYLSARADVGAAADHGDGPADLYAAWHTEDRFYEALRAAIEARGVEWTVLAELDEETVVRLSDRATIDTKTARAELAQLLRRARAS